MSKIFKVNGKRFSSRRKKKLYLRQHFYGTKLIRLRSKIFEHLNFTAKMKNIPIDPYTKYVFCQSLGLTRNEIIATQTFFNYVAEVCDMNYMCAGVELGMDLYQFLKENIVEERITGDDYVLYVDLNCNTHSHTLIRLNVYLAKVITGEE